MAYGSQHHRDLPRPRQIVDPLAGVVDNHQRVRPDVPFRVPFRFLRAVDQGVELGEQAPDDPDVAREREADRRPPGKQQQLVELSPNPFRRQIVEGDSAADRPRRLVDVELEACRKLHRAQHPQAVVAEGGRVDHAQETPGEVGAPPVGIEILLLQRVVGDGVHREVAPPRGRRQRQLRVADHGETPVAPAGLRFGAGERDVERAELEDRKAGADTVDGAESGKHGVQLVGRETVCLDVDILGVDTPQRVAYPAADNERAAARVPHGAGHAARQIQFLRHRARPGNRSRCSGRTGRACCGRRCG